jgi:EpsI family protein
MIMPISKLRPFFLGLLMVLAAGLAILLEPKTIPKDEQPKLEALIPKQFGDWTTDPSVVPILPSPDQEKQIAETYDQLVNRTYVNSSGKKIMISIAYGSRQDQKLKAHRQEGCYASQGFQISNLEYKTARIAGVDIPVTTMLAVLKDRREPVTYWFTVGSQVVQSRFQRLLVQIQYGMTGTIPDGVLVRVSNISGDEASAYQEHLTFINALLEALPPASRRRFVGNPVK